MAVELVRLRDDLLNALKSLIDGLGLGATIIQTVPLRYIVADRDFIKNNLPAIIMQVTDIRTEWFATRTYDAAMVVRIGCVSALSGGLPDYTVPDTIADNLVDWLPDTIGTGQPISSELRIDYSPPESEAVRMMGLNADVVAIELTVHIKELSA